MGHQDLGVLWNPRRVGLHRMPLKKPWTKGSGMGHPPHRELPAQPHTIVDQKMDTDVLHLPDTPLGAGLADLVMVAGNRHHPLELPPDPFQRTH